MKKTTFIRSAIMALIMAFAFVTAGWGATYNLCTSTSDLVAGGKYILVSSKTAGTAYALGYQNTSNRPAATATVTISASFAITTTPASATADLTKPYELTLGGSTGAWTLNDPIYNGYLYAASTSANQLKTNSTVNTWTITFSSSAAVLTSAAIASRNVLQYNLNGGSPLFSCYTSGQSAVYLYKLSVAAVPVVTAASPTGTVGAAFSYNIVATGTPTSYAVSTGTLPAGLSLNTGTGAITGTPTAAGSPVVGVTATNGTGTSAEANLSFTINKGSQSITFGALPAKTTADADFAPGATSATSGINSISYSSSNTAVATIVSNQIHIVGAGTSTITASQSGNSDYNAATSVDQTLTVTQFVTPQTITFNALDAKTYGDSNFDLTASSTSGLTISYSSSNTSVATVSGATVTVVGPGTTTITASQEGSAEFNPATSVTQDLLVNVRPLTIINAAVATKTYDGTNAAVITGILSGVIGLDVVTLNRTGTFSEVNSNTGISVTSTSTLGGANAAKYSLTQPTGLTGEITKASQTITFGALTTKSESDAKFKLTATTTSLLTISYASSNIAVATVLGDSITIVGPGTATITASQSGNGNYNAATDKTQLLTVTVAPIMKWSPTGISGYGDSPFAPTTVKSGVTVVGLTRGAGIGTSGSAASNAWGGAMVGACAAAADAITASQFVTFSIAGNAGKVVSLSTFDLSYRRSSTGPSSGVLQYAIGSGSYVDIATLSFSSTSSSGAALSQTDLSVIPALQSVGQTLNLRIVLYGNTGTGSWYVYTSGLSFGGTVDLATKVNTPSSSAKIYAAKGKLVVAGATEYSVYNAQGMEVANVKAASDNSTLALRPGIYVVKTAKSTQKVMVK